MKNMRRLICLCSLSFFFYTIVAAQDSAKNKINELTEAELRDSLKDFEKEFSDLFYPKKSYFRVGVDYLSDNVYFGRKDSVASPYITPTIGYYHKSGFHINASGSYLAVSGNSRFDLFTIDAGYGFHSRKVEVSANVIQYFYNNDSYNVESEIKQNAILLFGYDFGFVKPVIMGIFNFGKKADYGGNFGLEHSFFAMDDKLSITPTVSTNASTQNYYN